MLHVIFVEMVQLWFMSSSHGNHSYTPRLYEANKKWESHLKLGVLTAEHVIAVCTWEMKLQYICNAMYLHLFCENIAMCEMNMSRKRQNLQVQN